MSHRDDDITPDELAELGTLLLAERPRPSERFAAELDARVASRFAKPAAGPSRASRWGAFLQRPLLPTAAATTLAVGLVALVVALNDGGSAPSSSSSPAAPPSAVRDGAAIQGAEPAAGIGAGNGTASDLSESAPESAAADKDSVQRLADLAGKGAGTGAGSVAQGLAPAGGSAADSANETFRSFSRTGAPAGRKIERSASIELGAAKDRIDDAAQNVLATTARFGGIVDQSSVSSGRDGGGAQFALRIPSARLQPALAAFSRLPDTHVLARSDDQVDVNQAYVSIRRRLVNARAERAGVVRALAAADTEDETLRLRARLDELERTIAQAERAQRGLDRRIDFSTVSLSLRTDTDENDGGAVPFDVGQGFHDAVRVLEIAAGVMLIAAAALVPLALLFACAWPLARALRRRQREQVLDTA